METQYNEDFYDGVLTNIMRTIQVCVKNGENIQITFNSESAFDRIFLSLAVTYASLTERKVAVTGIGFFKRFYFSKKLKVKFVPVDKSKRILNVGALKTIIIEAYRDTQGVILSERIFKEIEDYFVSKCS